MPEHDQAFDGRDPSEPAMRGWGLPLPGELDRVTIVSPHLDDAVLGCANFMAAHPGVVVVTVFAGNPPQYPTDPMRKWDVQSGFSPGDDVMEVRRHEDRAALERLDAASVHLEFVEHTYNPDDRPVPPDVLVDALAPALAALDPTLVIAPFGLANPDHVVTHQACMLARERLDRDSSFWLHEESKPTKDQSPVSWWLYQDMGYSNIPGMLAWRVSSMFRRGIWPTPVCPVTDVTEVRKQEAIAQYPTQLRALEDDWAISPKLAAPAPEQFWRIAPPPPGWERLADS
ncbi:MAG: PIG-L deacetylase family protein [Acidimicrobiia bacterium]